LPNQNRNQKRRSEKTEKYNEEAIPLPSAAAESIEKYGSISDQAVTSIESVTASLNRFLAGIRAHFYGCRLKSCAWIAALRELAETA
jgi:hypothetical protein